MCRPRLLLRPLETRPLTQLLSAARALATVRVWKIWLERRARPRSDSQDAHGLPVMAGPVRDRATVIPENARFQTYKARRDSGPFEPQSFRCPANKDAKPV